MKLVNVGCDGWHLWHNNKMVGYVDEVDKLFGIDVDGYAVEICEIHHDREIQEKFEEWSSLQK